MYICSGNPSSRRLNTLFGSVRSYLALAEDTLAEHGLQLALQAVVLGLSLWVVMMVCR